MNSGPQLALGARGRDVLRVQTILVMMKILGFDQIDGVSGPLTRNAVIAFQEGEGLPAPCTSWAGLDRRPIPDRPMATLGRAPKRRSRPTRRSRRWPMTVWSARAHGGCRQAPPARRWHPSPG